MLGTARLARMATTAMVTISSMREKPRGLGGARMLLVPTGGGGVAHHPGSLGDGHGGSRRAGVAGGVGGLGRSGDGGDRQGVAGGLAGGGGGGGELVDRKSTRLNSSHHSISYA